jgi:hypothetical protein
MKMEYMSILRNVGNTVASTDTGMNTTKAVEKKTDKIQRRTYRTEERMNKQNDGKIRGQFIKRQNFLNSAPTSTQSALRLLSASSLRF